VANAIRDQEQRKQIEIKLNKDLKTLGSAGTEGGEDILLGLIKSCKYRLSRREGFASFFLWE